MPVSLSKVHHTGYIVRNLDAAMKFYTALLGKKPQQIADVSRSAAMDIQNLAPNIEARIAFYELEGGALELIEFQNPDRAGSYPEPTVPGNKHLAFQVDDISATYKAMVAEGYEFHAEPQTLGEEAGSMQGFQFAFFRDPDGNMIEMVHEG